MGLFSAVACVVAMQAAAQDCDTPLSFVSQTIDGLGTMEQKQTLVIGDNITTVESTVAQQIYQSFDVDKMNMVQKINQEATVHNMPDAAKIRQDVSMIFNYEHRSITMLMNGSIFDHPNCMIMDLPKWLPPAFVLRAIMESMWKLAKCTEGKDGIHNYEMNFPPKFLSRLPLPLKFHAAMQMDEKGLILGEHVDESLNMNTTKVQMQYDLSFNSTRLGGPSDADLAVPGSWGPCHRANLTRGGVDDLAEKWAGKLVGAARILPWALRELLEESGVTWALYQAKEVVV